VPKLVLNVSDGVPDLPDEIRKEKSLSVRRIRKLTSGEGEDIVAWLLDAKFIARNAETLKGLAAGSLLLWNPNGEAGLADGLSDEIIYEEILSFRAPTLFLRTLRNLFRRQHLERELALKETLLKEKEHENSELLQVGIALSAERDNDKLLDYILLQLRHVARADAGTLYLLERDDGSGTQRLRFKITQNDSNPRD
jgi:hypothetical protein